MKLSLTTLILTGVTGITLTPKAQTQQQRSSPSLYKPLCCLVSLFVCLAPASFAQSISKAPTPTEKEVPYLQTARQLVRDLHEDAIVNEYASRPTFLRWNHPTREARTVCATFVTRLLEHTCGWKSEDIHQWLGANGADASDWWEAIVKENGFRRFKNIEDVRPGDLLAIKYNDGSKDTGHVMLVDKTPQRIEATLPLERGTEQYRVEVIDSSASGHGPRDTRHKADGGFTGGIGRGEIRLYANREGRIIGYAWSASPKTKFYHSPARELVVGRLTREQEGRASRQ